MRYLALVTDYDGVVATDGRMSLATVKAIERLRMSGRRAILVTGRRLVDLLGVCGNLTLFDYVVAENGAVLFDPRSRQETLLAKAPPAEFIERLQELGVAPLEIGRVIVATWLPHHTTVLDAIQEAGLELQIIFNKSAVMVLPCGVNKATGVDHALRKLGLSPHEVVGIGDAQNDHSFLEASECAVAVSNALPSTQKIADIVTEHENGHGVTELIDHLVADDLHRMRGRVKRHLIPIGKREDGVLVTVPPYGLNILIAGPSGTGKSTVASGIVERLVELAYQLCIVDPEGDYGTLQDIITLGNQRHAVTVNEVLALLEDPKITLNVNLLGIPLADRPEFFGQLFPNLQAMRTRTGRPHWIVLDEAHHMLPIEWSHLGHALPQRLGETVLVTVHPDHLAPEVLSMVDAVVAVGPAPDRTIQRFASAIGQSISWPNGLVHQRGRAVFWFPRQNEAPFAAEVLPGRAERIRHHRKYAEGNMRHRSFFFRGPGNRHNLRSQNLVMFSQIAEGIDQDTWLFHLRRGDYSRWFRDSVKDKYLADQVERIERRQDLQPAETRQLIRALIEARYTLPE
ncbi:MAG: HAD-IIB family hydrolase [Planctomycetota bacterium]|nr:MAG: HAD-IIB family hydrolase [Planctomycetota bacterium]